MMFFGLTRFSVFNPGSMEWNASGVKQNSDADYLRYLHSEARLSARTKIFLEYSLPTLREFAKQVKYTHIIQYSENLPEKYINLLATAAANNDFIRLDLVTDSSGRYEAIYKEIIPARFQELDDGNTLASEHAQTNGLLFGFFVLDDDDVLSLNFMSQIKAYLREDLVGCYVSLGTGLASFYDAGKDTFLNLRHAYSPKINIGLTRICKYYPATNTYLLPATGSHTTVDRAAPVMLDSRQISYLWLWSLGQDTRYGAVDTEAERARIMTGMDVMEKADASEDIYSAFPFLKTNLKVIDSTKSTIIPDSIELTENFIYFEQIGIDVDNREFEIDYSLFGGNNLNANAALLSIYFEGGDGDCVDGFTKSPDPRIGWYRYLKTSPGLVHASITGRLPNGATLRKIGLRTWMNKDSVQLDKLVISTATTFD